MPGGGSIPADGLPGQNAVADDDHAALYAPRGSLAGEARRADEVERDGAGEKRLRSGPEAVELLEDEDGAAGVRVRGGADDAEDRPAGQVAQALEDEEARRMRQKPSRGCAGGFRGRGGGAGLAGAGQSRGERRRCGGGTGEIGLLKDEGQMESHSARDGDVPV